MTKIVTFYVTGIKDTGNGLKPYSNYVELSKELSKEFAKVSKKTPENRETFLRKWCEKNLPYNVKIGKIIY